MKKLLCAVILGSCAGFANAAAIPLDDIVNFEQASYVEGQSAVVNGLNDAFDFYGGLMGFGDLDVNREVFTHESIFSYGIFDTFTNNTNDTITKTVAYNVDLGSDGGSVVNKLEAPFFIIASNETDVSSPAGFGNDAAVSFLRGNNQWSLDNGTPFLESTGSSFANPQGYLWGYNITLAAGESVSLLNFATVYQDEVQVNAQDDLNAAYNISESLFDGTSGLTELNDFYKNAINFTAPVSVSEPPMLVLSALMLAGLIRRRVKS